MLPNCPKAEVASATRRMLVIIFVVFMTLRFALFSDNLVSYYVPKSIKY
jgi:hypothetical protein